MPVFDQVKQFLSTTTLNSFIDEKSVDLATLTEYTTIGEAMAVRMSPSCTGI
jgi:uncharacterized protein with HEPN domain